MNAQLVLDFEAYCSEPKGGVSNEVAKCIIQLAACGKPTEKNQKIFSELRRGTRATEDEEATQGIISLMAWYMKPERRGSVPELLRIVSDACGFQDRICNTACWLAPTCKKFLDGEIKMKDKQPVVKEAEAPPKSTARSSCPPPQDQQSVMAVTSSA
jgi:hypothetical protein